MRELKLKHYSLYAASFLLLWLADIPGGSILLIVLWQQMGLYLWQTEFSKKSQIDCLVHSLTLLPIFFFLGAVASFLNIYLRELNLFLLLIAGSLHLIVGFGVLLFGISFFLDYNKAASLTDIFLENIQQIKFRKFYFLKLTLFFMIATLLLQLLSIDYAIVAAYVLTHIMGKKYQTKLGYVSKSTPTAQAT
ncbi:MAG: hypothetical protein V4654_08975 [Bdellovibrionota bacterium]